MFLSRDYVCIYVCMCVSVSCMRVCKYMDVSVGLRVEICEQRNVCTLRPIYRPWPECRGSASRPTVCLLLFPYEFQFPSTKSNK